MLFVSFTILCMNKNQTKSFLIKNKYGSIFLAYAILINFIYFTLYADLDFLYSSLHWIYGLLIFTTFLFFTQNKFINNVFCILLIINYLFIIIAYFSGYGNYSYWPRYDYFFNGPNQLGYFSLCMYIVCSVIQKYKFNWILFSAHSMMLFVVIITGGRSSYLAVVGLFLISIYIYRRKIKELGLYIASVLLILSACNIFDLPLHDRTKQVFHEEAYSEILGSKSNQNNILDSNSKLSIFRTTNERITSLSFSAKDESSESIMTQLLARGYLRLIKYPQYLIFGSGQGLDSRFEGQGSFIYEIHSSFAALLFYYGIFGLLFFLKFFWDAFEYKVNIIYSTPLMLYGLFTYGLRSPYFWIALAYLMTSPSISAINED